MGARSSLLAAIILTLAVPAGAVPAGAAEARASADPIAAFLEAYRAGDCAAFRAFIRTHYHSRVMARPERVEEVVSRRALGHNGGIPGASSELRWLRDDDLVLIALCNREGAAPDLLRFLQGELGW